MLTGASEYAGQRDLVRKLFFKYQDANASQRVTELLEGMVK